MPGCIEPPPCVYVSPDVEPKLELGTVYVFHGQGWRPRGRVVASFTEFCPLDAFCDNNLVERRFRADSKGRFTFRLLFDFRRARLPAPSGIGGDHNDDSLVDFEQQRRRRGKVWTVRRDAIGIPPPSTPEQRAEAAALAGAVGRATKALAKRERAADQAVQRQFRAIKRRCGRLWNESGDGSWRRRGEVANLLYILHQHKVEFAAVRNELRAFADDLERLAVTDPVLRAGADTWIEAIRRPGRWPKERFCDTLRRWKAANWSRAARPIEPKDAEARLFANDIVTSKSLQAAEARMRALAAGRQPAQLFGGDLLEAGNDF